MTMTHSTPAQAVAFFLGQEPGGAPQKPLPDPQELEIARREVLQSAIRTAFSADPEASSRLRAKHWSLLFALVDANETLRIPSEQEMHTPFGLACEARHVPLAMALLDHGFDPRRSWRGFQDVHAVAAFSLLLLERFDVLGADIGIGLKNAG